MRILTLKPNHKRIAAYHASLTNSPSPPSSAMGLGCRIAYYDFLWEPEAWSRQARQHPAFQEFAKRMGLIDYWKHNRWPDLCQPAAESGPDFFICR
jgi:hypothetical protein